MFKTGIDYEIERKEQELAELRAQKELEKTPKAGQFYQYIKFGSVFHGEVYIVHYFDGRFSLVNLSGGSFWTRPVEDSNLIFGSAKRKNFKRVNVKISVDN